MKKKINIFKILTVSISFLHEKEKVRLLFLSLLTLLSQALDFLSIFLIYPFISVILDPELIKVDENYSRLWKFFGSPEINNFILYLSFAIILIIAIASLFNFTTQYISNLFAANCQLKVGNELLEYFAYVDYEWHLKRNSVKLMTLFTNQLRAWSRNIIKQIPLLIGYLGTLLIPIVSIIKISPAIGTICLIIAYLLISYFLKFIRKKTNQLTDRIKLSINNVNSILVEIIQGIKDVKLSSNEDEFIKKFDEFYKEFCYKSSKRDSFNLISVNLIITFSQILLIFLVTFLFVINISTPNLIAIITVLSLLVFKLVPLINKIGYSINTISNSYVFSSVLNEIHSELKNSYIDKSSYKKSKSSNNWNKIHLENVSYKYPNSENYSLSNINIEIKKGLHYGFVGFSGAGKSTTIDICNGLLYPTKGKVLIDKKNIKDFGIRKWQSKIGYVPQQPKIFDSTIKANIAFGIDDSLIDENKVIECLKLVGLKEKIYNLPNGISTVVGESGKLFSGGQKQLIAIARSLYKEPEIIIMDEATNSLDAISEEKIRSVLKRLHGKITLLTIAHNFSNIKYSDQIFLFSKGKLIEKGTPNYMYQNSSLFKEFADKN